MNKKFFAFLFALPLICLIVWTLSLATQQKAGRDVTVKITGYDPRDMLSGRYILYQIDWNNTDCTQFKNNVCPKEDFCRTNRKITHSWRRNLCRFYIPEKHADKLDKAFTERIFSEDGKRKDFEVVYSYIEGQEAIAKDMLINGNSWREFVK